MSAFSRPQFDPGHDFYATREFTFAGVAYVPGKLFDKTSADLRRLKQMYDTRQLLQKPPAPAPVVAEEDVPRRRRRAVA